MLCPKCNSKLNYRNKCKKCGFKQKNNQNTVDVDCSKIEISKKSSTSFENKGVFGNISKIFNIFSDEKNENKEDCAYDDFGNPIPVDVFGDEFVEIKSNDIEIIEE